MADTPEVLATPEEPGGRELVPMGDALLQTGMLSDEDARRVAEHQARTGLDFDRAAVDLALATPEDVAEARAQLEGSLALSLAPSSEVSDELVVLSDPASPRAEAIRLLRTQLISQHVSAGRRALAVCAAVDGSGATYISANLAAALSQVGYKTLLVDANLRNPRIDAIFGIDPSGPGLTSYLALQANRPERVIYPNVLPNLSIIPAGPPVARPQELLSGARFRAGVDIVLREFDVAIFDTPATNENADALTVAGVLGYALVVARRDTAFVKDVQALASQLAAARATLVGSVLNNYADP
ncbi:CpsD/CapB family tyrosine-protein kinase [Thermaurantiacus sp.]